MKRLLAFLLSLSMLLALSVIVISADSTKKLDMRELEEYGQLHFYLGEPVASDTKPNVSDATVADGEYAVSHQYKNGDKVSVHSDKAASAKIMDNEWVRFYLSYDEENLYVAMETKDSNYIKGKDGMAFNLGFRDKGRPVDAVSRFCFDIYANAGADDSDITTLNVKRREFNKKDNGDWDNGETLDGMIYINSASMRHDAKTSITTVEVAFDLYHLRLQMGNELDLKDIRMYFCPFVYMYGESTKGAGDVVNQGVLWCYLPSTYISTLKTQFAKDHPEATYWSSMVPNIVHFRSESETTTENTGTPSTTTEANVTTEALTTAALATQITDVEESTTAASGGCSGSLALLPVAIIPVLSVALINRKREEE